ncbi:unnamed protein product [Ectocarpus sp. 8 AP-2014]
MTGGEGAGTRTKNHGSRRKASAGGSVVGKNRTAATHHASAKKARGKEYPRWATHFLKRTCAHRKIPRMSQQNNKDVLVAALRSLDHNMKRPSPYFDDLDAIAAGKPGRGSEQEEGEEEGAIPAKALLTFRGVIEMVALARDSAKPFTVEGVDYSVADLYDALDKEDEPELGDSAGRSAPTGSSSTGGAAGPGGGGSAGGSGSNTERKGPHCMMRLVGILCEDSIRPLVISSRLQATRQELDTSAVGPRNNLWTEVTDRFRYPDHTVRKIVDDEQVNHVDPNIIQQPNISSEMITKMWSTVKAWNTPHANWKSESGTTSHGLHFAKGTRTRTSSVAPSTSTPSLTKCAAISSRRALSERTTGPERAMAAPAVPNAGRPPSGRARGSTSRTGGGRSRKRGGGGKAWQRLRPLP